jgi:peptidoglycan/xylan/chitin deacetylase (PgdA/CDA1 family)
MNLIKSLSQRLTTVLPTKPFLLRAPAGVISFTFDDFPRSALTIGGDILNRHQVAGTYYVAGKLTDAEENGLACHSTSDIKSAVRDGHEIASHGYAHIRYSELSRIQIEDDLNKNQRFLADILEDAPCVSFSYPFGDRGFRAKRQLADRFATARGTLPGINGRLCDLSDLRANSFYAHQMTEHRIRALIEKVTATAGWLIFYTHDVSDTPSRWGITPALLEFAVREAVASGCRVLPIRNAIGAVSFRGVPDAVEG